MIYFSTKVRVHPVKCPVGDNFRQLHRECFPDYSFDVEDKGNQRREWKGFPEATLISAKEVENGYAEKNFRYSTTC